MGEFEQYQAAVQNYDSEMYLGRLCWYSISELSHIDHSQFCGLLVNNGLSSHLPPVPRPSDVFKRACTAAQRRKMPSNQPNVLVNYLIREVGKDSDNIWRRLVSERVDTEGHKLDYTEIAEIHFYRPTSKIDVQWLDFGVGQNEATAQAVIQQLLESFKEWNNSLTPYAIRELVRRILTGMSATAVRPSGGVYFVRETHSREVAAMEAVIGALPGGSSFHSLPLVDDGKQRTMLKAAFEDESIGQVDTLLGEIGQILKSGQRITADRFSQFKAEHDSLLRKVADYSDLLDEAMEATASRLEIMNTALFELLGSVKT